MKRYLMIILPVLIFTGCKNNNVDPNPTTTCLAENAINEGIIPASEVKAIIDSYTSDKLPGITFLARKGDNYWQYNSGVLNKDSKKSMRPCLVWPGYSITKMYTATAILKLAELGKISLDQKINTCLPANLLSKIPDANKITIRMLLNHSSGIEDYWHNSEYVEGYVENPARTYEVSDYLEAAKRRFFEPGTDVYYSNTNYLILSLIIDHITNQRHEISFLKYIYNPLELSDTFYKELPTNLLIDTPRLYADVEGAGRLIDFTDLSYVQFRNESGSNSIFAKPKDFVDFIHGLSHGKLLNAHYFSEMKKEYTGNASPDVYGLGLEFYEKNGAKMYGYAGSSFGGRTLLLYNPKTDVSFFIGVNAGAELGGPVLENIAEMMEEIATKLAN